MLFEKIYTLVLSPKFIILILFFIISKLINSRSFLAQNEKGNNTKSDEKIELESQETLDSDELIDQFDEFISVFEGFAWFLYFAAVLHSEQPMLIGISVIFQDMLQKNLLLYIKKRNEPDNSTSSELSKKSSAIDSKLPEEDDCVETSKSTFEIIRDILDSIF